MLAGIPQARIIDSFAESFTAYLQMRNFTSISEALPVCVEVTAHLIRLFALNPLGQQVLGHHLDALSQGHNLQQRGRSVPIRLRKAYRHTLKAVVQKDGSKVCCSVGAAVIA